MLNNDVLRRLRYSFELSDTKMISLFALADHKITRAQISSWLKKEDTSGYEECSDLMLAVFLNGFINEKRGKRDGEQPKPESYITNNLVFKKLRIALNLRDDDILSILKLVNLSISKHELSAFFRAPEHRQFRQCKDQVIRNFLHGLQLKYRPKPESDQKEDTAPKVPTKNTLSLSKPKFQWNQD
jgi:uncharacterized protein YehS (DUF1456 family)